MREPDQLMNCAGKRRGPGAPQDRGPGGINGPGGGAQPPSEPESSKSIPATDG
jgi:hypothetical protein